MWIFQHLPKTGGTSLTSALRNVLGPNNVWSFQGLYPNEHARFFAEHPMPVKLVTGHVNFGFHCVVKEPCRYVTIMRKTVPRVISMWYNQYWWNLSSLHTHNGIKDFEEYVSGSVIGNNMVTRMICGWPNCIKKTFVNMRGPCTGEMYSSAIENIEEWYSYVGFQDSMQESFDRMLRIMGEGPGVEVPIQNVTKSTVNKELVPIPENAEALIKEHNQYDIAV